MKRYTIPFCIFIFCGLISERTVAQSVYGNEWINFNNTYKKVKIAHNRAYKITAAELDSLGFGSVPGHQFSLIRDGQEVPIYTSTSGVFGTGDYILFYGRKADGTTNTPLYPSPNLQPDTQVNLFTDSATYYLTYDNTAHKRLQMVSNSIPTPAPTPAPYCWVSKLPGGAVSLRQSFSPGQSYDHINEYFYSSDFDLAEGYSMKGINAGAFSPKFSTYKVYSGAAPSPKFSFVASSITNQVSQQHHFVVTSGSTTIFDTTFSGYGYIRKNINVPIALLSGSSLRFRFSDNERFALFIAQLSYSRNFQFINGFYNTAQFKLPTGERFINISFYNIGSGTPLLFDVTNNKIYTGKNIRSNYPSRVEFYLDNDGGDKEMYLTNQNSIVNLTNFKDVHFRDYSKTSNQGNYIILTHKHFINANPNYVQQYANYRAGVSGGSYHPVIIDVTELYDHFGYGYDMDPLSIKRFIKFAEDHWQIQPQYLFIIGKGIVYNKYFAYRANRSTYNFPVVPTWGNPGSDNLFSSFDNRKKPTLSTGRLSVYNNQAIGNYLEKVKEYANALKPAVIPTPATELWKKRALHIAGMSNGSLQQYLLNALNACGSTYEDTLIGGSVTTIAKSSTNPVQNINDPTVDSLINSGVNVLTYYGHASSSGFDYNLDNPDLYHAKPRFPIFMALGCDVGQIFALSNQKTISEHYIHSKTGGAIVMVAEDNFGYTSSLTQYIKELYKGFSQRYYGQPFGEQYRLNINHLQSINTGDFMNIHTQCLLYQGDPAVKLFNPLKPDYAVEENHISAHPANLSTSLDSFRLKVVAYNLGEAIEDTVLISLEHTHVGNNTVTFSDTIKIPNLYQTDTLYFDVPIDKNLDIGMNNYTVRIDPKNRFDEISEQNNQATIQLFIYANKLVPIYPYQFSIVHQQGVTLKASTLNAFAPLRHYKLQIDTTAKFNSPLLLTKEIASIGGVIEWKPNLIMQDSVVYYWRTAVDSVVNGSLNWTKSSFIYLAHGSDGWNQSHYYQFLNDEMVALDLPSGSRQFEFAPITNQLLMENKVVSPPTNGWMNVRNSLNGVLLNNWACIATGVIHIMVFDQYTGQPWQNNSGDFGSNPGCTGKYLFEFPTNTLAGRDSARMMIKDVPDGDYIMISNAIYGGSTRHWWDKTTKDDWMADTAILGSGHSVYHAIKDLGFTDIDQFDTDRVFIFFRQKGNNNYPIKQIISPDDHTKITLQATFKSNTDTGRLKSTIIGPARQWQQLIWKLNPHVVKPQNDYPFIEIFGINHQNQETKLYSGRAKDTSLSFIDAQIYPKIRMVWNSVDTTNRTSADLKYWRVLYKPVPEAALNAAQKVSIIDSLTEGQAQQFKIAIDNLTPYDMDSMLVKYKIVDAQNNAHLLTEKRYRKLPGNDSLIAFLKFNADKYPGKNFLYIEANPDHDQPEQYHPNNIGLIPFNMKSDDINPLLDVTFDGVHILNKDIVSAKPFIKILLKDENKFAPLTDTSLLKIQLLKPNEASPEIIPFDGEKCKFIPAEKNGKNNEARVELRPNLKKDGVYKLMVTGKDNAGNYSEGNVNYEVQFKVIHKSTITNVLNYPNPFSTSTQFVFTITGFEIPSQFKIQILTVTGKVVREITKAELGPLHIGRNITPYHWDGRDQYGQLLGNGVYLYRVVTSLNGHSIEHRSNTAIDKYFKNGYGKLYIMR